MVSSLCTCGYTPSITPAAHLVVDPQLPETPPRGGTHTQDRHQGELRALDAELAKVDAGIDRYLRAFETGAMPEALCGERVKALGAQATALRARREQLADEMDDADLTAPTAEELSVLRERVTEAVAQGSAGPVKALLQALIHEIRVDSRQAIHPTFRVPLGGDHHPEDAVRAPSRSVGRRGLEPLTPCASCKCATNCANGPWLGRLAPGGVGSAGARRTTPWDRAQLAGLADPAFRSREERAPAP